MDSATILAAAALITALGGLLLNYSISQKNLAETKKIRGETKVIRDDTAQTNHQLNPNGGGSVFDAVARTEKRTDEIAKSVGGIRDDVRGLRQEKSNDHEDIRRRLNHIEARVFPSSADSPTPPRRN